MQPVTSPWRDGRKEMQAPHVDIVHLVPWKSAARRHRRFQNYTVGQVRELTRRGIAARVVTVGLGQRDGRDGFADVPFLSLPTLAVGGRSRRTP